MHPDYRPTTFDGKIDHVVEECSELIKAVLKMKRFGTTARDPETGIVYDNIQNALDEAKDVALAVDNLMRHILPYEETE